MPTKAVLSLKLPQGQCCHARIFPSKCLRGPAAFELNANMHTYITDNLVDRKPTGPASTTMAR